MAEPSKQARRSPSNLHQAVSAWVGDLARLSFQTVLRSPSETRDQRLTFSGSFTNAQKNYYAAPQQIDGKG